MEKLTVILAANASKQLTMLIVFLGLLLVFLSALVTKFYKFWFISQPPFFLSALLFLLNNFVDHEIVQGCYDAIPEKPDCLGLIFLSQLLWYDHCDTQNIPRDNFEWITPSFLHFTAVIFSSFRLSISISSLLINIISKN